MNIFKNNFQIKFVWVVICILVVIAIIVTCLYLNQVGGTMWGTILGGFVSSLLVAIIQLIISYKDYDRNESFRQLKLVEILRTRDNRDSYHNYIATATDHICVMGVSAVRFFRDFADVQNGATEDKQILLNRLKKGVKVRILLPDVNYLRADQVHKYEEAKTHLNKIKSLYPEYAIELRYFDHKPYHSIFVVDNTCIVGPIFPELESQYTTSLKLQNSSALAEQYLKHFEIEWKSAHE